MINNKPERFLVFFPSYNSSEDEDCQNYVSYSCKLDNIEGITKSYGMAVHAADQGNGKIFEEVNGELHEVRKSKFKN